jgi:hypothetical protein
VNDNEYEFCIWNDDKLVFLRPNSQKLQVVLISILVSLLSASELELRTSESICWTRSPVDSTYRQTIAVKCEVASLEAASLSVFVVVEALFAVVEVEFDMAAFQNENDPVDCNRALDDRSTTTVAITPGFEDNRSRVCEKLADAFWSFELAKL